MKEWFVPKVATIRDLFPSFKIIFSCIDPNFKVITLMGYGYAIEAPDERMTTLSKKSDAADLKLRRFRMFRIESAYAVREGKWYFEFECTTDGEMRVGWASPEVKADQPVGQDALRLGLSLNGLITNVIQIVFF